MAKGEVKTIKGRLIWIGEPKEKTYQRKDGSGEFTVWSLGIRLDSHDGFLNAKSYKSKKGVFEYIYSIIHERYFRINDEVEVWLESEDEECKWWRIVSIVMQKTQQTT